MSYDGRMKVVQRLSIMEKAVFLMGTELFREVATDEAALIAARTTEVEFEPGETINLIPEYATSFLLLVEGTADHTRGDRVIRTATKGAATGLMGLVGIDEAEQFPIIVSERIHAIALSRETFFEALTDYPRFGRSMLRGLAVVIQNMAQRIDLLEAKINEIDPGAVPPTMGAEMETLPYEE